MEKSKLEHSFDSLVNAILPVIIAIFILFLIWALSSILEEMIYPSYCNYKDYTIELHYLNGESRVMKYNLPEKISFQINCHSHKGDFRGCSLQYVNEGLHLSTGHWITIAHGVNHFKLLNDE